MDEQEQEKFDIATMRDLPFVHVEDPAALQAFKDGRVLFDVSTHGRKLSKLVNDHPEIRRMIRTGQNGLYPSAVGFLVNNRPVYFGAKKPE